jgi:dTDP-4-dehydrorhamnose reductase
VNGNTHRSAGLLERVVIVGGAGQLGTELCRVLSADPPVVPDRRALDLEDADSILTLLRHRRPTLVINAAAYHHVELCEVHPERAFGVNALGVDRLAAACALVGAALVTVSTDYVFDGNAGRPYREDDPANPLSAYGASKLAGEQLARRHGERLFVVRTSGLYGLAGSANKGYTFIEKVLAQAERGEEVRVVDDMIFSPSYAAHVAEAIVRIARAGRFGLYHVTNAGACSWHEFAREAFRLCGLDAELTAIKYDGFGSAVRRPRYSALEHAALAEAGLPAMPHWHDGLAEYLRARSGSAAASR